MTFIYFFPIVTYELIFLQEAMLCISATDPSTIQQLSGIFREKKNILKSANNVIDG